MEAIRTLHCSLWLFYIHWYSTSGAWIVIACIPRYVQMLHMYIQWLCNSVIYYELTVVGLGQPPDMMLGCMCWCKVCVVNGLKQVLPWQLILAAGQQDDGGRWRRKGALLDLCVLQEFVIRAQPRKTWRYGRQDVNEICLSFHQQLTWKGH